MDIILLSTLFSFPTLLFVLGVAIRNQLLIVLGSIGLFTVGVISLASAPSYTYLSATNTTITNVTNTTTNEYTTYEYGTRALTPNYNLVFSVLPIFLGLAGLIGTAVEFRRGGL